MKIPISRNENWVFFQLIAVETSLFETDLAVMYDS